jgi:hypothetical protein
MSRSSWLATMLIALAAGGAYLYLRAGSSLPAESRAPAAPDANTGIASSAATNVSPLDPRPTRAADPVAENLADPYELIASLARRAYEGDGKAQYRVSRELDRCEYTLALVRKEKDHEAALWGLPSAWTHGMKERAISEYRRCRRLLTDDPFAQLPPRAGGYHGR